MGRRASSRVAVGSSCAHAHLLPETGSKCHRIAAGPYRHPLPCQHAARPFVCVLQSRGHHQLQNSAIRDRCCVQVHLVDAIQLRDYPVVQNLTMFIAVVVVLANLAVDLLYAWADPRIKYEKA